MCFLILLEYRNGKKRIYFQPRKINMHMTWTLDTFASNYRAAACIDYIGSISAVIRIAGCVIFNPLSDTSFFFSNIAIGSCQWRISLRYVLAQKQSCSRTKLFRSSWLEEKSYRLEQEELYFMFIADAQQTTKNQNFLSFYFCQKCF